MIAHFIEASNQFNWGKFMLARLDADELQLRSALPGYERESLIHGGGLRKLNEQTTLVFDLQTGEGAVFSLAGPAQAAAYELEQHRIWVCPMFEPLLCWLYEQGTWASGEGDFRSLPRYVDLNEAEPAQFGYRRSGGEGE